MVGFYIENSASIIHQINIFESYILVEKWMGEEVLVFLESLSVMSCSFDIIALVNFNLFIKDICNHHEINLSIRTLVLHFIKSIDSHDKCIRVFTYIICVILKYRSKFFVLIPANRLDYDLWVLCVIHEASTFALWSLIS